MPAVATSKTLHSESYDREDYVEASGVRRVSEFPDPTRSCAAHFADALPKGALVLNVCGREKHLDFADGLLHAVTCFEALDRAQDAHRLLSEIRRVLCEDGLVAVSLRRGMPGADQPADVVRSYCPEDLDALLIRAGFSPESWLADDETLYVVARRDDAWGPVLSRAGTAVHLRNPALAIYELMGADLTSMPGAVQRELALLSCEALGMQGRLDQAIELAATADELDRTSARVPVALGSLALSIGDVAAAVESFEEATHRAPDCYAAWLGLALANEAHDDLHAAIIAVEIAHSLAQGDRRVVEAFARLARRSGAEAVALEAEEIATLLA
jgi:tetratricopeptide (TPR) repeat protein